MQIETIASPAHHRINLESAYRVNPATGVGRGHGKDRMSYDGAFIGESRQPAFDAARYLLTKGLALPGDKLTTYRDGKPCLFTTAGRAAKLAIREDDRVGPMTVAYRPFVSPREKAKAISGDHQALARSISAVEELAA